MLALRCPASIGCWFALASQKTREIVPLLVQCRSSVCDAGPALNQQRGNFTRFLVFDHGHFTRADRISKVVHGNTGGDLTNQPHWTGGCESTRYLFNWRSSSRQGIQLQQTVWLDLNRIHKTFIFQNFNQKLVSRNSSLVTTTLKLLISSKEVITSIKILLKLKKILSYFARIFIKYLK